MTEEDARTWVCAQFGSGAVDRLNALGDLVRAESARQNLVAASTLDTMWVRHLLDSAQLVPLAPITGMWLDIGTGAGFPGLVVAALRSAPIMLVEPRRRRADFLTAAANELHLRNVDVRIARVEQLACAAAVISARAVGSVEKLLRAAQPCASMSTRWLLPRGKVDATETELLTHQWSGSFHVKQSLTDPASAILIADAVMPRKRLLK